MAIIWMDGFNTPGQTQLTQSYFSTASVSSSTAAAYNGRYDGKAVNIGGNSTEAIRRSQGLHKDFSNTTTISIGFAFRSVSGSAVYFYYNTVDPFIIFYNGTASSAASSNNNIVAGMNFTQLNASSPVLVNILNKTGTILSSYQLPFFDHTVWNFVEVELQSSTTAGQMRIYLNGNLVSAISNANFSNSTSITDINKVAICGHSISSNSIYIDDFYITNTATRLGEIHIATVRPSADTAQKDWTPSTGTANFSVVNDDNYSSDTTYITTNASNKKDIYDLQDLSVVTTVSGTPLATKINGVGYKTTFGQSSVNLILKSGTTEANGTAISLYEGASGIQLIPSSIYETDPSTAIAWTVTGVNNSQIGIRTN